MKKNFVFTSESVTEGHPDKLCDQISDAIVDYFLARDPYARVVTECAVAKGVAFVATRFAATISADIPALAREVIQRAGYTGEDFNAEDCSILTSLVRMREERVARDEAELDEAELGQFAGRNQVTAFGFACTQTPELMPLPIHLAHQLARRLSQARREKEMVYLTPDGTFQVGVEYQNRKPHRIHSINVAVSQYEPENPDPSTLQEALVENVIRPVFADEPVRPDKKTRIFVNPGGPRIGGGPAVHAGLTGRKTAMDTYGDYARQSGSALSGKDPLRVDRIAAYAARHAAKTVVAAGLASECEVQLSYAIGLAQPVSIQVETFGTGTITDEELTQQIETEFDFRVGAIIRDFRLRHLPGESPEGFFQRLAVYGQVGRADLVLPWEDVSKADALG